ncbi:MAG TPA: tetratricopeptide repeat protein [Blastocatellia bacterium]|nr:tetratricopeptide repeat protein [Blastocatellia bacterium]
MIHSVLAFLLCFSLASSALAQQKPGALSSNQQQSAGFILPADVNVRVESDPRTLVVMAAINEAGFDAETGGQPLSPLRAELRKDLKTIDPQLKAKLAAFYQSHRRAGVDEMTDATRYAALSLLMTPPPGFNVHVPLGVTLPEELQSLLSVEEKGTEPTLQKLVREFYVTSGFKNFLVKYTAVADAYATAYRQPVGELLYQTLEYFHASPETIVNMRPLVISPTEAEPGRKKQNPTVVARNRSRQVFVITDPLLALNTSVVRGDILNQQEDLLTRRVGDDYIVIVGPSRAYNIDGVRQALIRFVIDPLVERHLKFALDYKEPITKLVAGVPTAARQYQTSVYLVMRESLAQAAEARLKRLRAMAGGAAYSEDDATFDLAQAYLRGAVLTFHFYGALRDLEATGLSLETFIDQMVATTKFDREATRAREFEPVVARVTAARNARKSESVTEPTAAPVAKKMLASDDLIRQKKFAEARVLLESVLAEEPNNARALYGLGQVLSSTPSAVELDPKADENDKIQAQHDRFEQAIKLYRKAIDNASPESEKWLIQWSHVLLGRIYDFQEFRNDALAEYDKAIEMGDIPNGALKEARDGKLRPFGSRQ